MKDDSIETLNFDETIEIIDSDGNFNTSDEMLDFSDTPSKNIKKNDELKRIINNDTKNVTVEIDANKEKINDYKPSIKDFNIKSSKTRKIVKKVMIYLIIAILIGVEVFINKAGKILTSIRVSANTTELIKIVKNNKYGYIDYTGNVIVNPKYIYADDFVKGYAIVKNSSNLPLIINKGGKEVVPTGEYFSLYRSDEDIIASKITKSGLKYGLLDTNLKRKTKFIYDGITYLDGIYTYTKGNSVGILNKQGKDIYNFKLTDSDDKVLDVKISKNIDSNEVYAVVKVNSTSQIINIEDGSVAMDATLNKVVAEDNNVFYEDAYGQKLYMYVKNNKVIYESDSYLSMSIESSETGVLKCLKKDYSYEYISTDTLTPLKNDLSENEVFLGQNVLIYKDYDTKKRQNKIVLVKDGKIINEITSDFEVVSGFINGAASIKFLDGTFSYINEDGKLITDKKFAEVNHFDELGQAIAKTSDGYGVIDLKGNVIIPFENNDIKMAKFEYKKKSIGTKGSVFFAVKKQNLYALYDKNGKRINKKEYYSNVSFDDNYPILRIETELSDYLYMPITDSKINLTSSKEDYLAYDNYIKIKNEYYNYKGKLIYQEE